MSYDVELPCKKTSVFRPFRHTIDFFKYGYVDDSL